MTDYEAIKKVLTDMNHSLTICEWRFENKQYIYDHENKIYYLFVEKNLVKRDRP